MQKSFFYFDEIYLIFSFVACAFGVTAKKSFPNLLSWCLCTSFSLRSFIIFTLRCLIHFQLIFVYDVRPGFSFFFFFLYVNIYFSQHHFFEDSVSLICMILVCLPESIWPNMWGFISGSTFLLVFMFVYIVVSQCFDYCHFVVSFEL